MDLRQLRCFLSVAGLLSFTKAAKRLGMTQPGVSYQVSSLEQALSLKLFNRGPRAVQLTASGHYFFSHLQRLCAEYESVIAHCRTFPGEDIEGAGEPETFPDIRQLQCFLAVVHRQNFTKAGEDIFRTQSGISYQIASLEKSLGRKLFHRAARSISLTEFGRLFFEQVCGLVADYQRVLIQAQSLGAGAGGSLTVGFLGVVFMQMLPGLIREFSQACPGARVKTVHVTLAHMFDAILAGEIDCGFALIFNHDCPPGIQTQLILKDRMMAAMSVDHPFASRKKLKLSELRGQPLLSITPAIAGVGVEWHRAICEKHGLDYDLTEFSPDFPSMFLAISMGSGIAIQPRRTIEEHGNARLRSVEIEDDGMDIEFVVAWKAEGANPLLPLFLQCFNRVGC
ncbi:LysR family transcriptional regulator [Holophaga foetida]|uniref:LysR family transcriptional regulator n=1 Tax=Holophaga foetida TaxID=35839 RepID=UPI000247182F|nr:LysR family transcriptional regulator [Holophaga foetida]